jgi:hypothetical protein
MSWIGIRAVLAAVIGGILLGCSQHLDLALPGLALIFLGGWWASDADCEIDRLRQQVSAVSRPEVQ